MKTLPDAVYVHRSALTQLSDEQRALVDRAYALAGVAHDVVKVYRRQPKVAFLSYPGFFREAFPALKRSCLVDLTTGKVTERCYFNSASPPILHRKEEMLPPWHEAVSKFCKLTEDAERAGLFADTKRIGTRKEWDSLIRRAGLMVRDHRLVKKSARRIG